MKTLKHITLEPNDMRSKYTPDQLAAGVVSSEQECVFYGPYITLEPGKWTITINGSVKTAGQTCFMDVAADFGQVTFAKINLQDSESQIAHASFVVLTSMPLVEFRVWAGKDTFVKLESIVLSCEAPRRKMDIYEIDGFRLVLDKTSHVDRTVIATGQWERAQLDYIKSLVAPLKGDPRHKIFLDIGSYFGLYSLQMLKLHFFDEIKAFEVDWYNYRQLISNLLINDINLRIRPYNNAVSSKTGSARFVSSLDHEFADNRGATRMLTERQSSANETMVEAYALDDLIKVKDALIFIKLDVELHELEALKGMRKLLANNSCTLQIECYGEEPQAKLKEIMAKQGYTYRHHIDFDFYFTRT